MSLLSICQAAASTAPVAQPLAIIGNTDETAQLLLGLANDVGDELARAPPRGWVAMEREFSFYVNAIGPTSGVGSNPLGVANISGVAGADTIEAGLWIASGTGVQRNAQVTAVNEDDLGNFTIVLDSPLSVTGPGTFTFGQGNYLLPGDFQRPIDNTFWDRSRYWAMRGPLSPQAWQSYKSSLYGNATIERRYRFRSITIPASLGIGLGEVGVGGIGGNIGVQQVLSIDPFPFDNGANLCFEYVSNAWCQDVNGNPQSLWQADTDVGILDEYLMRLSLKYRLLRRLGLSYSEELDEYMKQLDKAMAHDGGSQTLNIAPMDGLHLIGPGQIQEGNFPG